MTSVVLAAFLAAAFCFAVWDGWRLNLGSWSGAAAKAVGLRSAQFDMLMSCAVPALFFALALLIAVRKLIGQPTVVLLTAEGILDSRIAPQLIPWTAIQDVSAYRTKGGRVITLQMEPAILATFSLPAQLKAERALGIKGIKISAKGLGIRHGRLQKLMQRFFREATVST